MELGNEVGNPFTFVLECASYVAAIQIKHSKYLQMQTDQWCIRIAINNCFITKKEEYQFLGLNSDAYLLWSLNTKEHTGEIQILLIHQKQTATCFPHT